MHCFTLEVREFEIPRWRIQDGRHQNSRQLILRSSLVAMVTNLSHTTNVKRKLRVKFGPCNLNLRAKTFAKPIFASNQHKLAYIQFLSSQKHGKTESENLNPIGFLLFDPTLEQNSEKFRTRTALCLLAISLAHVCLQHYIVFGPFQRIKATASKNE